MYLVAGKVRRGRAFCGRKDAGDTEVVGGVWGMGTIQNVDAMMKEREQEGFGWEAKKGKRQRERREEEESTSDESEEERPRKKRNGRKVEKKGEERRMEKSVEVEEEKKKTGVEEGQMVAGTSGNETRKKTPEEERRSPPREERSDESETSSAEDSEDEERMVEDVSKEKGKRLKDGTGKAKGGKEVMPVTPGKKVARRLFGSEVKLAPKFRVREEVDEVGDSVESMGLRGEEEEREEEHEEEQEGGLTARDLLLPCAEEAERLLQK